MPFRKRFVCRAMYSRIYSRIYSGIRAFIPAGCKNYIPLGQIFPRIFLQEVTAVFLPLFF